MIRNKRTRLLKSTVLVFRAMSWTQLPMWIGGPILLSLFSVCRQMWISKGDCDESSATTRLEPMTADEWRWQSRPPDSRWTMECVERGDQDRTVLCGVTSVRKQTIGSTWLTAVIEIGLRAHEDPNNMVNESKSMRAAPATQSEQRGGAVLGICRLSQPCLCTTMQLSTWSGTLLIIQSEPSSHFPSELDPVLLIRMRALITKFGNHSICLQLRDNWFASVTWLKDS